MKESSTICRGPLRCVHADKIGRPGFAPGIYLRLLMVNHFEGIDSKTKVLLGASDSFSIRLFVRAALNETVPGHPTLAD